MANPELLVLSILRALTEVAMLSLLGQGLVGFLAGARRGTNPVYQLFNVVTAPVVKVVRHITPRVIIDKHLPFVTFFLLFWLWILLAYVKRIACEASGVSCIGG